MQVPDSSPRRESWGRIPAQNLTRVVAVSALRLLKWVLPFPLGIVRRALLGTSVCPCSPGGGGDSAESAPAVLASSGNSFALARRSGQAELPKVN